VGWNAGTGRLVFIREFIREEEREKRQKRGTEERSSEGGKRRNKDATISKTSRVGGKRMGSTWRENTICAHLQSDVGKMKYEDTEEHYSRVHLQRG